MTFAEKERKVINRSYPLDLSRAFRKAMRYISETNEELYKELIRMEYEDAFEEDEKEEEEEDEDYEDEDDED
jgi:hypothetical protein